MRLSSAAGRRLNLSPSEVTSRPGDEGLANTLDCSLFDPNQIYEYRYRTFYNESGIIRRWMYRLYLETECKE
jgi:hypothetical protein